MYGVLTPTDELRRMKQSEAKRLPQGSRIRWARARKRLSHDKLAAAVGTSRSYLIKIEKGHHSPGIDLLEAIARETDVSVDFLRQEDEDEEEAAAMRELLNVLYARIERAVERQMDAARIKSGERQKESA